MPRKHLNSLEDIVQTKKFNSTIGIIALLGILIFGNVVATRLGIKVDITEEKLYTLSEGSINIVDKLDTPLDIKLFFSQSLEEVPPILKTYHQRVRAMLEELQSHSENISLEFIDPEPDSDEELLAQRFGITGQPLSRAGNFYFGIVLSNYAGEENIAYLDFNKEDTLEYDIVRKIYLLSQTGKPKVGVLSSLNVLGDEPPPAQFGMPPAQNPNPAWLFTQELKQSYELVKLDAEAESLENDLDLLLVIHAKNLSEKMQYAIDQFVMSGKRAIFYVDPFYMKDQQGGGMNRFQPPSVDRSFDKLFDKWGIKMDMGKVVLDPLYAYIQRGMGQSTKIPMVVDLKQASMSDDVSTKKLNHVMMLSAGHLELKDDQEGINFKPLISTSDKSVTQDKMTLMYSRPDQLMANLKGDGKAHHLAGLYSGTFRSAFDKAPEGVEGEHLGQSQDENHVVVIADVDMLEDTYWAETMNFLGQSIIRARNQNTVLLNNLVEKMTGNNDLISLRSRSRFVRPFDKVLELEEQARREYQTREQELQSQLQKVEQEINQLMQKADPGQRVIVSADVQKQINEFQDKKVSVAKELRKVRKNLRSSIDELGIKLQAINILLMPLLIALYGLIVLTQRSRRISA